MRNFMILFLDRSEPRTYSRSMLPRQYLISLLGITALAGGLVALRTGVTYPMPGYMLDTVEWARTGHIADTFTPLAYPLFAGVAYRFGGLQAAVMLQLLLQMAIAAISYWILRELRLSKRWSAIGSLPVALFPETLFSIPKVWDVGLSTFLLLLFVLVLLEIDHRSEKWYLLRSAVLGVVFAALVFCRPNLVLLLPVACLVLLAPVHRKKMSSRIVAFALFLIMTGAGFALLGIASHGSVFWPQNGPYNLYAGQNPQAMSVLLDRLNAEGSLDADFVATHPGVHPPDFHLPGARVGFTHRSVEFAREHPGTEVELVGVKLFTLFRPDTKVHPLRSLWGVLKGLLALPVFLFLGALLWLGRPPLDRDDWLLLVAEALYIVPFLMTNSDPRFRFPLDALLLLHLVSLFYRRFTRQAPLPAAAMHQTV